MNEKDSRQARIGVIGGSGLYQMEGLSDVHEVRVETPFGSPSDAIVLGTLEGQRVAFLPRHGRGHRISPTDLPARANIYALKSLGVEFIISVSAVGSLKEEVRPLDLVLPDQIIDRTRSRVNTFFEGGLVVHCGFAEPFCPVLRDIVFEAGREAGVSIHREGTYVVMEGPLFSTRAEAELYRSWGASVVGMTALPEAKLAREAEICYATVAVATDYDCWRQGFETVTIDMVIQNLLKGVDAARQILRRAVTSLPESRGCACATALKDAIVTAPERIAPDVKERYRLLVGKYLP